MSLSADPSRPPGPILVADDDPVTRLLFSRALGNAGFETVEAATGRQVLAAVDERDLRGILLDNRMPGPCGPELIRELRSRKASQALPIIVVTGLDSIEDRAEALRVGANGYLTKPVELAELLTHVRAALCRHAVVAPVGARGEEVTRARTRDAASDLEPAVRPAGTATGHAGVVLEGVTGLPGDRPSDLMTIEGR